MGGREDTVHIYTGVLSSTASRRNIWNGKRKRKETKGRERTQANQNTRIITQDRGEHKTEKRIGRGYETIESYNEGQGA